MYIRFLHHMIANVFEHLKNHCATCMYNHYTNSLSMNSIILPQYFKDNIHYVRTFLMVG